MISTDDLLEPLARTVFDESSDAILIIAVSGMVLHANPAAERLLDRSRQELRTINIQDLIVPFANKLTLSIGDLLQTEMSVPTQRGYWLRSSESHTIPIEIGLTRLTSHEQEPFFWATIRPDRHLSESVALRTPRNNSELILDTMEVATVAFDHSGEQTYVNDAFCRLVGWGPSDLLGKKPPYLYWPPEELNSLQHTFNQILHDQIPSEGIQLRFRNREGRRFPTLLRPTPLRNDLGERIGWVSNIIDIAELKRTEAALRASEERFRSLCASSPMGIFMASPEGLWTWTNSRLQLIGAFQPESVLGNGWLLQVHPDDRKWLKRAFLGIRAEETKTAVFRFIRPDGEIRWVQSSTSGMVAEDGRSLGFVGIIEDITERRQAEVIRSQLETERSELLERLQLLLAKMPVACVTFNEVNEFTYWNPAAERIFGYTSEEVLGRHPLELIFPSSSQASFEAVLKRLTRGESVVDSIHDAITKDGRRIISQWQNTALRSKEGNFLGLLSMCQDITDRKRSEEILRESERRYRLLADNSSDVISRHDLEGRYLYASPASTRLTGYSPGELMGQSFFRFLVSDDEAFATQKFQELIEFGKPQTISCRFRCKDGRLIWFESTARLLCDLDTNESLEIHIASRDVTERQRAVEALSRSEQKFRALIEKSSEGFALVSATAELKYCSPATQALLGYSLEELMGVQVLELIHPEELKQFREQHGTLPESGDLLGQRLQIRIRHKDQSWRTMEIQLTNYLHEPSIEAFVVNYRDITEQLRLEDQLRQSQKMEAIGKLAGGIAHDFNNILTAIIGNVAVVMNSLPPNDANRNWLAVVDTSARRAAELTSQLLGFSRRTTLRMAPMSLAETVREALVILKPVIDPRIQIQVKNEEKSTATIIGDKAQMTSVVVNLCINARDAMPSGGVLIIELKQERVDEEYVRQHVYAQVGNFVRLRVSDNGCGIPADILPRIFEPFFTTKPTGQGTGLGLSMVYGTINAHKGWITCESEVGRGTRFDLYLPRIDTPMPEEVPSPQTSAESNRNPAQRASTVILLADDEPAIRNLGRRVLEMQGFKVLLAEDGVDALEVYRKHQQEISLVILDLTMPRMSGQDTFKQLVEIDPKVRVIFSSGYSADSIDMFPKEIGFINKPYRPDELNRAVRQALALS